MSDSKIQLQPPLTFTLRVHASLAIREVINKVSGEVLVSVLDSLEFDDPRSKLKKAGWVVHQFLCTGINKPCDERVVTQTEL